MNILQIVSALLIVAGAVVNYTAKIIAGRFNLALKVKVSEDYGLTGEELEKFKQTKAVTIVKIIGFIILLPGVVLVFFAYR